MMRVIRSTSRVISILVALNGKPLQLFHPVLLIPDCLLINQYIHIPTRGDSILDFFIITKVSSYIMQSISPTRSHQWPLL